MVPEFFLILLTYCISTPLQIILSSLLYWSECCQQKIHNKCKFVFLKIIEIVFCVINPVNCMKQWSIYARDECMWTSDHSCMFFYTIRFYSWKKRLKIIHNIQTLDGTTVSMGSSESSNLLSDLVLLQGEMCPYTNSYVSYFPAALFVMLTSPIWCSVRVWLTNSGVMTTIWRCNKGCDGNEMF